MARVYPFVLGYQAAGDGWANATRNDLWVGAGFVIISDLKTTLSTEHRSGEPGAGADDYPEWRGGVRRFRFPMSFLGALLTLVAGILFFYTLGREKKP